MTIKFEPRYIASLRSLSPISPSTQSIYWVHDALQKSKDSKRFLSASSDDYRLLFVKQ